METATFEKGSFPLSYVDPRFIPPDRLRERVFNVRLFESELMELEYVAAAMRVNKSVAVRRLIYEAHEALPKKGRSPYSRRNPDREQRLHDDSADEPRRHIDSDREPRLHDDSADEPRRHIDSDDEPRFREDE